MAQVTSLRIDTPIKPSSLLRTLLYASLTSALILLAWLAALSLWQYIVILIISAAVTSYLALSRPILLHLSQPPLPQRVDQGWQLLMRTGHGDVLWQAELLTVHRYRRLISFEFIITEPYRRSLSMAIFCDQVSAEQWRELNVLANMMQVKSS